MFSARRMGVTLVVLFGMVSMMCSNPVTKNKDVNSNGKISISGTLAQGLGKMRVGVSTPDSIVAVPCINGEFAFMDLMRNATINSDGTFSIALEKSMQIGSGDLPVEWVLLLIDSHVASRFDRVLGFVALKDINQSLIKIPVDKAKGDVHLDTLHQNGNEAQSGDSVAQDTSKFSLSISQLQEMMRTGKTLKLAQNAYANFHGNDGEVLTSFLRGSFGIFPTYTLKTIALNDVENTELLPAAYLDTTAFTYSITFMTFNTTLYNYAQIASRAISIDLYPPTAVQMPYGPGFVPITMFSTDSTKNPAGLKCWIPNDNGMQRMGFGTYKGVMPNGKWQLKTNGGAVTSEFDLGLGNPFDSSGHPVVYVPSVNVSVNSADTSVSSVTLTWYSWDASSQSYMPATDADLVKNAVSWAEVHLMSDPNESVSEKIGFGISSNGAKQPRDMGLTLTATPTNKYTYSSPLMIMVSFRTGGQEFDIHIGTSN
jgi:hypothetical protein